MAPLCCYTVFVLGIIGEKYGFSIFSLSFANGF